MSIFRVRSAVSEGLKVIDVDGSYLPHKHEQLKQAGLQVVPLSPPSIPPIGWDNHKEKAEKIPVVLPGMILPPHPNLLPISSFSLSWS